MSWSELPEVRVLETWTGPHGVPSRIGQGPETVVIPELARRGCGAWVGDHICGSGPTRRVVGGTDLMFATYVSATMPGPGGLTHAFLCALHDPGDGRLTDRLIADMRQDILNDQRRELRRFWSQHGRGVPYPLPNLLEPNRPRRGGAS